MGWIRALSFGAVLLGVALSACSREPKQPLPAGYFTSSISTAGILKRVIIVPGSRRASLDVWRVSKTGGGTAKHAHYDLIAPDDVPSSGTYEITQDGSDCGSVDIQPYSAPWNREGAMLRVTQGLVGESFGRLAEDDTDGRYQTYDDAMTRAIENLAYAHPQFYANLSSGGKAIYDALNPNCTFD